jgi:hypothetical protein
MRSFILKPGNVSKNRIFGNTFRPEAISIGKQSKVANVLVKRW